MKAITLQDIIVYNTCYYFLLGLRDFEPSDTITRLNRRMMRNCREIKIIRNSLVTNTLKFFVNLELKHGPAVFSERTLVVEIVNVDSKYSLKLFS